MRILFIFYLSLFIGGCGLSEGTDYAELAVTNFHAQYNEDNYQAIYENATSEFQNFVTQSNFIRILTKLKDSLGDHKNASLIKWEGKSSFMEDTTITLFYSAEFEEGRATETFTFKVKNGVAQLQNFNVNSATLNNKTKPNLTEI